eukprot:GEMP01057331.1.p1 GENE.GEMP01057331.1~~GEMP01057331.1.p1  ORF type:complete len:188 (+),score=38.15 GEMP01057331.1:132-695(+)
MRVLASFFGPPSSDLCDACCRPDALGCKAYNPYPEYIQEKLRGSPQFDQCSNVNCEHALAGCGWVPNANVSNHYYGFGEKGALNPIPGKARCASCWDLRHIVPPNNIVGCEDRAKLHKKQTYKEWQRGHVTKVKALEKYPTEPLGSNTYKSLLLHHNDPASFFPRWDAVRNRDVNIAHVMNYTGAEM